MNIIHKTSKRSHPLRMVNSADLTLETIAFSTKNLIKIRIMSIMFHRMAWI